MGFKAWASLLIVTIACLFLSWLLHILVESPSQKLGKQLAAKLTGRRLNTPALQQGA
jgi:peptidoglycan/LPS O-acetylase OafA/YrhL